MPGICRVRSLVPFVLALALAACGDEAGPHGGPRPAGAPPDGRATAVANAPPPAPLPAPASAPVVAPATPGKAKISPARFAELSTRDLPGFERSVVSVEKSSMTVTYESAKADPKGVRLYVIAVLENCGACRPIDVAMWSADPDLRHGLPAVAAGDPRLVFDVHELDLGVQKGIGVYRASFVSNVTSSLATHGYQAWFNDGSNAIRIDVSPHGPAPKTREEMLDGASRDDMAAVAKAVFARFASEF